MLIVLTHACVDYSRSMCTDDGGQWPLATTMLHYVAVWSGDLYLRSAGSAKGCITLVQSLFSSSSIQFSSRHLYCQCPRAHLHVMGM